MGDVGSKIDEFLKNTDFYEDDRPEVYGVLLADEIKWYVDKHNLIDHDNFDIKNLRPASYDLSVGYEYSIAGDVHKLDEDDFKKETKIVIKPFQVAVIGTKEKLNLPRFMIGRWNIKVGKAYDGLLWVGGPQVDPGFQGHLYCPIYNLSDTDVELKCGETIASLDFIKTTPLKINSVKNLIEQTHNSNPDLSLDHVMKKIFLFHPKRINIDDYSPLKSGLLKLNDNEIGSIKKNLDSLSSKIDENINHMSRRLDTSVGTIYTALAVIVATLSIVFTSYGSNSSESLNSSESILTFFNGNLDFFSFPISVLALIVAMVTYYNNCYDSKKDFVLFGKDLFPVEKFFKSLLRVFLFILLLVGMIICLFIVKPMIVSVIN